MYSYRSFPAVFACALILCGTATPQTKPQAPPPPPQEAKPPAKPEEPPTRISVSVNEVVVPVTVTDDKGRFVSNLVAKDFRILDEGQAAAYRILQPRRKTADRGGLPGGSEQCESASTGQTYQEAIEELVLDLLPGDPRYAGYLIGYSTRPSWRSIRPPIRKRSRITSGRMKPGGGAALFDAIYMACTSAVADPRRAVRAAARDHHHRRRPRQRQHAYRQKCWNWPSATWSRSTA